MIRKDFSPTAQNDKKGVSYKPSGIEWLGEIPKHWEVGKLGDICEIVMGEFLDFSPTAQNDKKVSLICHSELSQESEESKKLPILDVKYLRNNGERKLASRGNLANINDRLILMDGENSGEIFITKEKGFLGSTLKKLKISNLNQIKFVDFVLLCYKDFFKNNKKGTAIPHLDKHLFANHKIPLPPLKEQKEIAEFLDEKCEKIQNYINKKQRLITLLQEKKQALINEAICGRIACHTESPCHTEPLGEVSTMESRFFANAQNDKKGVSYKPSGIEWLGEIPQSWKNVSIRSCFTESNQRCNTDSYPLLSVTIANGIIYQDDIENKKDISNDDKSSYKIVPLNAVAYNKMRMWQGAVGVNTLTTGIVSPAYIVAIPNEKILPNFVSYLFKSKIMIGEFDKNSYGLCLDMNNLRYDDFRNIKIPLPPLKEQKEIAEFLDSKVAQINSVIEKTKKQIELVKEYKNTLINEAVCGRIACSRDFSPTAQNDNNSHCHTERSEVSKNIDFSPTAQNDKMMAQNDKEKITQNDKIATCHTERSEVSKN